MNTLTSTLVFIFTLMCLSLAHACEKHQRIHELLEESGITEELSSLNAALEQLTGSGNLGSLDVERFKKNFREVINPQKILLKMKNALAVELDANGVDELLAWYKGVLSKRFLEEKKAAYQLENLKFVLENYQNILEEGKDKAVMVDEIYKALNMNMFIEHMQLTLNSIILITMHQQLGTPKPWNLSTQRGQLDQNTSEHIATGMCHYLVRDFTLEELNELKEFTVSQANVKFISITFEVLQKAINESIEDLVADSHSGTETAPSGCSGCCSGG